jgi:hypothetical protein
MVVMGAGTVKLKGRAWAGPLAVKQVLMEK